MLTSVLQPRDWQVRACGEKNLIQMYISSDNKKDKKSA